MSVEWSVPRLKLGDVSDPIYMERKAEQVVIWRGMFGRIILPLADLEQAVEMLKEQP